MSTIILYMFQAYYTLIIRRLIALMQHLVSSSQSVAIRSTGCHRMATDSKDDTSCCINAISLLMMST